jgi:hypothetical protein
LKRWKDSTPVTGLNRPNTGKEDDDEPDIVKYIKINRFGWAGHAICMNNNKTVKKVFNTKPIGIRKTGRPKLRWEDVIQDIKTLGVKNWRNLAMEKESWQKLLRKARAHVGLSSQ